MRVDVETARMEIGALIDEGVNPLMIMVALDRIRKDVKRMGRRRKRRRQSELNAVLPFLGASIALTLVILTAESLPSWIAWFQLAVAAMSFVWVAVRIARDRRMKEELARFDRPMMEQIRERLSEMESSGQAVRVMTDSDGGREGGTFGGETVH